MPCSYFYKRASESPLTITMTPENSSSGHLGTPRIDDRHRGGPGGPISNLNSTEDPTGALATIYILQIYYGAHKILIPLGRFASA